MKSLFGGGEKRRTRAGTNTDASMAERAIPYERTVSGRNPIAGDPAPPGSSLGSPGLSAGLGPHHHYLSSAPVPPGSSRFVSTCVSLLVVRTRID